MFIRLPSVVCLSRPYADRTRLQQLHVELMQEHADAATLIISDEPLVSSPEIRYLVAARLATLFPRAQLLFTVR